MKSGFAMRGSPLEVFFDALLKEPFNKIKYHLNNAKSKGNPDLFPAIFSR